MKYPFTILFFLFLLFSCEKEPIEDQIVGTWVVVRTGCVGAVPPASIWEDVDPERYGTLEFRADGTLIVSGNGEPDFYENGLHQWEIRVERVGNLNESPTEHLFVDGWAYGYFEFEYSRMLLSDLATDGCGYILRRSSLF